MNMELFAIIEERDKDKVTELYLEQIEGQYRLSGFTVSGGILEKPSDNMLDVFDAFNLSANIKKLGKHGEYDVVLDLDSGLNHFFKGGREDIEKLFMWNGICVGRANWYKPYRGKGRGAREILFKRAGVTFAATFLSLSMFFTMFVSIPYVTHKWKGETINLVSGITYALSGDEVKDGSLELEDIREYIYEKSNIKSEAVKDFLWKPELISNVLPYYEGTSLDIVTRIRHFGLNIESFSENDPFPRDDRILGEYRFGHTLFVRDFDEETFDENSKNSKSLGHEYVHLLQTSSVYPFVCEASAELIAQEYFKDAVSSETAYSYKNSCKYLKVLMEIIGSEPIWENNFKPNSTLLDESVKPYLSEKEFKEFVRIMKINPAYQFAPFEEALENLLETMHMNKYGTSMYDDRMISAILNDCAYSRVYFRESLREQKPDYCEINSMSIEEAIEAGYISLVDNEYQEFSLEDYLENSDNPNYRFIYAPNCRVVKEKGIVEFDVPQVEYISSISEKFSNSPVKVG